MKNNPHLSRLEEAKKILLSAHNLLLEGYRLAPGSDTDRNSTLEMKTKSSFKDLVTVYDKKVEDHLISALKRSFPGENIVGEESVAAQTKTPIEICRQHQAYWILDPIDGTTNYARAYPFFCSTMAWVEVDDTGRHIPKIGLTYNPVSGELFWAAENQGAWIHDTRLKVSPVHSPEQSLLITGFASERSQSGRRSFELFEKMTKSTLGVRRDGSAALDLAYVASGRVDAYWEWGLAPWDTAAGALLVLESGGRLSDHDGNPFDFLSGKILATNGILHDWLVKELKT